MAKQEAKVNPIQVQKYLKGEDYPTDKQELIRRAREEGAPDEIVSVLEQLPEKKYESVTDVTKELGNIV